MKVYTAGGMVRDWRDRLKNECPNFTYLNPTDHNLKNEKEYTIWDLIAIRNCDILFGYMERENPSGYGLNLEIGYAFALGKMIILVDETEERNVYMGMARSVSNLVVTDFEHGIEVMKSLHQMEAT